MNFNDIKYNELKELLEQLRKHITSCMDICDRADINQCILHKYLNSHNIDKEAKWQKFKKYERVLNIFLDILYDYKINLLTLRNIN